MSAYGPFELAPLEAVPVPDAPIGGAPAELEAIRAAAYDEGFAAATEQLQGRLEGPASALAAAAQQLQDLRADAAASVEAEAVELALRIAEQALGAALAVDRELVVDVVRGALRRLVERDRVLIFVNPDDLEVVREHTARLVGELGGIEHCEVQAERRVRPGGAIVRTAEGEVDATLETKLARAREVLEHELAREGAEPGHVAEARRAPLSPS
jgi:flagellar biosynthesis/type III secretory pathway protein FliH